MSKEYLVHLVDLGAAYGPLLALVLVTVVQIGIIVHLGDRP